MTDLRPSFVAFVENHQLKAAAAAPRTHVFLQSDLQQFLAYVRTGNMPIFSLVNRLDSTAAELRRHVENHLLPEIRRLHNEKIVSELCRVCTRLPSRERFDLLRDDERDTDEFQMIDNPCSAHSERIKALECENQELTAKLHSYKTVVGRLEAKKYAISQQLHYLEDGLQQAIETIRVCADRDATIHQQLVEELQWKESALATLECQLSVTSASKGFYELDSKWNPTQLIQNFEELFTEVHSWIAPLVTNPKAKKCDKQQIRALEGLRNTFVAHGVARKVTDKNEAVCVVEAAVSEILMRVLTAFNELSEDLSYLRQIGPSTEQEQQSRKDADEAFLRSYWKRMSDAYDAKILPDNWKKDVDSLVDQTTQKLDCLLMAHILNRDNETQREEIVQRCMHLRLQCGALGVTPFLPPPRNPNCNTYVQFLEQYVDKVPRGMLPLTPSQLDPEIMEIKSARKKTNVQFDFAYFPGLRNEKTVLVKCRAWCS
ncbi:uncharacterized protein SPPG_08268 [Spizellomyces punctatus DAOM BR117]|uniref:Uncharacterized protein n=1 Tax=Spizellomyces punctatus (strain DAOM BR117) TaxID=645134 RepID=A0A0L0H6K9_SPIPD|nr:uncharacterized protein SPPG_08268 [Spizellomyces punctatus DAOM BR117]KNC96368.1 hypothetical protein SPPG_08268 [Spizellomyces punctatus DAOM BR117]|eukprot:XP_016604408.1 hypothetical protein SPPG_08268 [Spizellomyces punctatus DAOM BR117]